MAQMSLPKSPEMQQFYIDLMDAGVESAWAQVEEWTRP